MAWSKNQARESYMTNFNECANKFGTKQMSALNQTRFTILYVPYSQ